MKKKKLKKLELNKSTIIKFETMKNVNGGNKPVKGGCEGARSVFGTDAG